MLGERDGQMNEITAVIQKRFSLINRLSVKEITGGGQEQVPLYFGMLLAVMNAPFSKPVCFVFPRLGDVARLASLLHGISSFSLKFPLLAEQYAKIAFKVGQHVCVRPDRHVYVYDGLNESGKIWLRVLEKTWGRRTFDIEEILRLEPTTRKRPIGRMDTALRNPQPAVLDRLLNIKTYGNQALFSNEVLLLDSKEGFESFVDRVTFQSRPPVPDMCSVRELLPFGSLKQPDNPGDPWICKWDQFKTMGESLIAFTYSAEVLANCCIDATAGSKLVIVNGISRLQNLQAYDDIAQTQRLILFADHDDMEMMKTLGERECRFWWIEAYEMLGDVQSEPGNDGLLGSVARRAWNMQNFHLEDSICKNARLEHAYDVLKDVSAIFINSPENEETPLTRLVSSCWRMLGEARSAFQPPVEEEKQLIMKNLQSFQAELRGNKAWLTPHALQNLEAFIFSIMECYSSDREFAKNKGEELQRVLRQSLQNSKRIGLLIRNENRINGLRLWLGQNDLPGNLEIFSFRTLPVEEFFDHLICVSWPNADTMTKVAAKFMTARLTIICYPFESAWANQFRSRINARPNVAFISGKEKAVFVTGIDEPTLKWPEEQVRKAIAQPAKPDMDIWALEYRLRRTRIGAAARPTDAIETIPARYVRFMGDFYAFLTESHKLPVVTSLLSHHHKDQAIPERTVVDLKIGDFIVFPESGDRELIQLLADKMVGSGASELREKARSWQKALQESGMTPEQFHKEALRLKRPRHPFTIRHWFEKSSQIGPQAKDDLILIACVTNDKELLEKTDDVQNAIDQLRGAHLSAGMYLRNILLQQLQKVIGNVQENGGRVNIGDLGSAWIVQVEYVDEASELRGRYEVNHLLSE